MGLFDDVVINAKSAAEAVGKKAGQLVDASKLRFGVAELNAELSKRYEALGQYVYENCREALSDPELVGKFAELDELKLQHAALTKELTDKQNKVVCPTCGKQSANSVRFCSNCGTQLVTDPAAPVVEETPAPAEEPAQPEETVENETNE